MGAELECGSQFKVHGADQVILCEKQQSLSIYFLRAKLLSYILTTWGEEKIDTGFNLNNICLCAEQRYRDNKIQSERWQSLHSRQTWIQSLAGRISYLSYLLGNSSSGWNYFIFGLVVISRRSKQIHITHSEALNVTSVQYLAGS